MKWFLMLRDAQLNASTSKVMENLFVRNLSAKNVEKGVKNTFKITNFE